MRRFLLAFCAAAVLWTFSAQTVWAQAGNVALADGWSGPGYYLNVFKVAAFWLIFLCWVWTTDWVSRDAQEMKLDYLRWNPIVFGVFMGAFVLAWIIPFFWVNLGLLLVAYIAPLTTYIVIRNKSVAPNERVLTRDHLRYWFAQRARLFGVKVQAEALDPHEAGPPVVLTPRGAANERESNIRLIAARQSPGFREARQILADGLTQRADGIMLDFAQQAVAVRYQIDGVWLEGQARDRESSDPALASLKILCGLNPQDRQARQEGKFTAELRQDPKPETMAATLSTQATPTGERVLIRLERTKTPFKTLDDLGMRQKMQEQLLAALGQQSGFVVLSAMPASGLRTTTNIVLRTMDRYMREFVAVEDESNRYEPIENVPVTTYKPEQKHDLHDLFDRLFHQEPNVAVVRDLVDANMVSTLLAQVHENRMIVSTIRAKECAEAVLRLLAMKVPPAELANGLTAVLCQRLVRKLCEKCKEAYAPTAEMLRQLQIPEGKVQAFYRPPQPSADQKEVCKTCGGIGYYGRTAIFELMLVDDNLRRVIAGAPKLETIRQAARRAGMRTLQEEGVLLVARGVTSLQELTRVMRQ